MIVNGFKVEGENLDFLYFLIFIYTFFYRSFFICTINCTLNPLSTFRNRLILSMKNSKFPPFTTNSL